VNLGTLTLGIGTLVRAQSALLCPSGRAHECPLPRSISAQGHAGDYQFLAGNVTYPYNSSQSGPPPEEGSCTGYSGGVEVFRSFSWLALSDPYQLPVLGWGSRIGEVEGRDVDVAYRYPLPFGPRPSGCVLATRSQTHSVLESAMRGKPAYAGARSFRCSNFLILLGTLTRARS